MSRGPIFLMGGGWNEAAYPRTYGRFAAAARTIGTARIACVSLDGEDREMHYSWATTAFLKAGVSDTFPVYVSRNRPLRTKDLETATGVFVAGGVTPEYYDAIVPAAGPGLATLVNDGVPYAGISAGAMIAASDAIIGGWKLRAGDADLVICSEEVAEEIEYLDVRAGLGLVPFAVDAHASQYGTPTRLLHAVNAGRVREGWAIDEETMLEVSDGAVRVRGLGSAYHIWRHGGQISVDIVLDDGSD